MTDTTPAHGHLWTLDDGTPVHAPPGRLTRNDEGQVCCHLCGHWFDHLGAHLRRHGWSAADYRAAVGLAAGRALCNAALSATIARRQATSWHADAERQADFHRGRVAGTRVITARDRDRTPAPEVAAVAAENLRRVRARRERERLAVLRRGAAAAGVEDVDVHLARRYEAGDSLADLQRLTGWSRPRVREHLAAAGVAIRPSGATTTAGRQNRAAILESRVAARLGTDDVDAWLRDARRRGLGTQQIARRAGRSPTWVRTRLSSASERRTG